MKKWLLGILLLAAPLFADTTTSRMGLVKPDESSTGWGPKVRANYDIIDASVALLSGTNLFTSSQTFSGVLGISTMTVSGQVLIATPTYSGSARMALNGIASIGGGTSGGVLQVCDQDFLNCNTLGGSTLSLDGSPTAAAVLIRNALGTLGSIQLVAGANNGAASVDGSNLPNLLSADSLLVGPTYGDRVTNIIGTIGGRSAFEEPVYIGTHTASGSWPLVVYGTAAFLGSNGSAIDMCNADESACTRLVVDDTILGIQTSTMTFTNIQFNNPNMLGSQAKGSIRIGGSAGNSYYPPTDSGSTKLIIAIGPFALYSNAGTNRVGSIIGGDVAIGSSALFYSNDGVGNTAIGDGAGGYLRTGSYNNFLGWGSGAGDGVSGVSVSTNSIYIGQYTGASSSSTVLVNSVAIGAYTRINQSDSVVFGIPAHNPEGIADINPFSVGIGTDTPKESLHVVGDVRIQSGALQLHSNTASNIRSTTPGIVGAQYYCSDCATVPVCISTGTAQFQWSLITNRASACQ